MEPGEKRQIGQARLHRLGDAEINHFWDWRAIDFSDQNIRGLQIPMDYSLLMRMLDGLANPNN